MSKKNESQPTLPLPELDNPVEQWKQKRGYKTDRVAFGRVPKPSFHGVDPIELEEKTTPEDRRNVGVVRLRALLMKNWGPGSYEHTLLHPVEFESIIRNHDAFETRTRNKALRARLHDENVERRNARADRSVIHALEQKAARLDGLLEFYVWEAQQLEELLKRRSMPGYAHRPEEHLQMLSRNVWFLSLHNMVETIGLQMKLTKKTSEGMKAAIDLELHTENYWYNFEKWGQYTQLALDYVGVKSELAAQNQLETELRIGRRYSEYCSTYPNEIWSAIGQTATNDTIRT